MGCCVILNRKNYTKFLVIHFSDEQQMIVEPFIIHKFFKESHEIFERKS